jgi:hypothetical protein
MLSIREILQSECRKAMLQLLLIPVLLVQPISSLPSLIAAAAQVSTGKMVIEIFYNLNNLEI